MVLEDLLSEFNAHKLVRIPGLIQSLVNLDRASPTDPEVKLEGLDLSIPARKVDDVSFNLDAVAVMEQVKLIERQYISENLKVEQVCEDVVQRMKGLLSDQRRLLPGSSEGACLCRGKLNAKTIEGDYNVANFLAEEAERGGSTGRGRQQQCRLSGMSGLSGK